MPGYTVKNPHTFLSNISGASGPLAEPAYAVAPGQAAVLYDEEAVVGFGLVTSARST